MLKMSNKLFIITAPSGAGKTTLIKRAIDHAKETNEKVHLAVSHTTRNPRAGEVDGKDYSFISEEEFKNNIAQNEYLEYALVHGNLYGTPKSEIQSKLKADNKVLLEIDWQGAIQIMEHYPEAESIFISPPSVDELRKRLTERGLDTEEVIERRIRGAQTELDQSQNFKHQISNISLDIATKNLLNIMFRENHG
jgi:guanylate kinase